MRPNPALLSLTLILATVMPAGAQETPARLAARLGSTVFSERESAARKLEQLGAAALPALRLSLASADLETRRRALELMERIEDRVLREQAVNATPIQLQFDSTPVRDALAQTIRAMRLPTEGTDDKKPVTVKTGAVPYWQAWRDFCKAADLVEFDNGPSAASLRRVREDDYVLRGVLTRGDMESTPEFSGFRTPPIHFTTIRGPVRYAEDVSRSIRVRAQWRELDQSLADGKTHAVFAFEIRPEPRLLFATLPRIEITKIVDDAGVERPTVTAKMVDAKAPNLPPFLVNELQFGGRLQLKPILWKGPVQPIKEMHGRVRMDVLGSATLLELPIDVAAAPTEDRGADGLAMKLVKAERKSDELHLTLRFERADLLAPKPGETQVVRVRPGVVGVLGPMDVIMQRLEVRDPRGWKCKWIESSYHAADKDGAYLAQVAVEIQRGLKDPYTLVLTKAPRRVAVEVPFVVRDLIVPAAKSAK